ncbi:MAG: hypothetical protein AAF629_13445 [Chloroflexota bacterium]
MPEAWLEIADENIDVKTIIRQIQVRVAQQQAEKNGEDPEAIAKALWQKMIEEDVDDDQLDSPTRIRVQDTDIVPRSYVIDWRIPIIGPIHGIVRRVINAEIRRFLMPSLNKQSQYNRRLLSMVRDLQLENQQLRKRIELLTDEQESSQ